MTVRRRHGTGATVRPTHVESGVDFGAPSLDLYGSVMDTEAISVLDLGAGSVGGGAIVPGGIPGDILITPGTLPPTSFDTTPPAVPSGFTVTSELATSSNGDPVVAIKATFTPPGDADYYGTYVEFTNLNDGAIPTPLPDWSRPTIVLVGKGLSAAYMLGAIGAVTYWARARAVDVQGNYSAYTAVQSAVSLGDSVAPPIPQAPAATGGYRGATLSWTGTGVADLMFYQVRYKLTSGSNWTIFTTKNTVTWIPGLTPDVSYDFQVRAVDFSGNVETSSGDSTAINYLTYPDAGYTATVTATPRVIGYASADIAANSITAAMITTAGLTADLLKTGKLTVKATGGATAVEVYNGSSVKVGEWEPTLGIKVYDPLNAANYGQFNDANLRFYQGGILTVDIGPSGIKADSITFGALSGGHNVVLNSSFELAAFVLAPASVTFTDTTKWKAGDGTQGRTAALDNITEGTALTMLSVAV